MLFTLARPSLEDFDELCTSVSSEGSYWKPLPAGYATEPLNLCYVEISS